MTQPSVPLHFFDNMLRDMGWPRTQGFPRRRTVVDASAVDSVVEGILEHTLALAVVRRDRALQVFAHSSGRIFADGVNLDWENEPVAAITELFEKWFGWTKDPKVHNLAFAGAPWKALWEADRFTSGRVPGARVPWEVVAGAPYRSLITTKDVVMSAYGLQFPEEIRRSFERKFASDEAMSPTMERLAELGLVNPQSIPTNIEGIADQWNDYIQEYETAFGPLPPTPRVFVDFFQPLSFIAGSEVRPLQHVWDPLQDVLDQYVASHPNLSLVDGEWRLDGDRDEFATATQRSIEKARNRFAGN